MTTPSPDLPVSLIRKILNTPAPALNVQMAVITQILSIPAKERIRLAVLNRVALARGYSRAMKAAYEESRSRLRD